MGIIPTSNRQISWSQRDCENSGSFGRESDSVTMANITMVNMINSIILKALVYYNGK